jgi:hypothetical protein
MTLASAVNTPVSAATCARISSGTSVNVSLSQDVQLPILLGNLASNDQVLISREVFSDHTSDAARKRAERHHRVWDCFHRCIERFKCLPCVVNSHAASHFLHDVARSDLKSAP